MECRDKWWLKISCPVCPPYKRREPVYWHHTDCKKIYNENNDLKLDINGKIFCNGCHKEWDFKDFTFTCENHDGAQNPLNLANVIEVLQVMINMNNNISDQRKFAKMIANISNMYI